MPSSTFKSIRDFQFNMGLHKFPGLYISVNTRLPRLNQGIYLLKVLGNAGIS